MEEWKDIIGFDGVYKVSTFGNIKSMKFGKEVILIGCKLKHGHKQVQLFLKGKSTVTVKLIHRIVAEHFIPNPNNLPCVCHKDETLDINGTLYNGEDNLFWGTHSDNMRDMVKKGRAKSFLINNKGKFGKDCILSKKVHQYSKEGTFIKTWDSTMDIQRTMGIVNTQISNCCLRKQYVKTAGGFRWSYTLITQ